MRGQASTPAPTQWLSTGSHPCPDCFGQSQHHSTQWGSAGREWRTRDNGKQAHTQGMSLDFLLGMREGSPFYLYPTDRRLRDQARYGVTEDSPPQSTIRSCTICLRWGGKGNNLVGAGSQTLAFSPALGDEDLAWAALRPLQSI